MCHQALICSMVLLHRWRVSHSFKVGQSPEPSHLTLDQKKKKKQRIQTVQSKLSKFHLTSSIECKMHPFSIKTANADAHGFFNRTERSSGSTHSSTSPSFKRVSPSSSGSPQTLRQQVMRYQTRREVCNIRLTRYS